MHPSRRGRRLGGLSGGWVYLSVHWPMVFTWVWERRTTCWVTMRVPDPDKLVIQRPPLFREGRDLVHHVPACSEGARACWGGGGGAGLLLVPPHFCWGGVGAAKSLLPSFLVPKGNQPTACTLALWWLKFGPTEQGRGGQAVLGVPKAERNDVAVGSRGQNCPSASGQARARPNPVTSGARPQTSEVAPPPRLKAPRSSR